MTFNKLIQGPVICTTYNPNSAALTNNDPVWGGENNNIITLRFDLCHLELKHGHSETFNHTLCSSIGCAINTNRMNFKIFVPKITVVDVREGGSTNVDVQFQL